MAGTGRNGTATHMSFDDVVRLDNSNGDLEIVTPDSAQDVLNVTTNISLACVSEWARGERSAFDACFSLVFDLLVLKGVYIDFWPPRLTLPWEDEDDDPTTAAAPATASAAATAAAAAPHVDGTHHHYDDHDAVIYPLDAFVFFFSLFFLFLIFGTCWPYQAYGYDYPSYTVVAPRKTPDADADADADVPAVRRLRVAPAPTAPTAPSGPDAPLLGLASS